jgi:hypothetical protein
MFDRIKNMAAKVAINKLIDGIAIIQELEINIAEKTIIAQVALSGEEQPIRIQAHGYRLGPDYIVISRFTCDKPWIETALNRFIANREIKIPHDKVMRAIEMIM